MERTFAIIKPDAVERGLAGQILSRIEEKGFKIVGMKKIQLSLSQAQGFYYVHKERPFFNDLANAEPGTIRKDFAKNIEENSAHGSDAPETAAFEIPYFFSALELVG